MLPSWQSGHFQKSTSAFYRPTCPRDSLICCECCTPRWYCVSAALEGLVKGSIAFAFFFPLPLALPPALPLISPPQTPPALLLKRCRGANKSSRVYEVVHSPPASSSTIPPPSLWRDRLGCKKKNIITYMTHLTIFWFEQSNHLSQLLFLILSPSLTHSLTYCLSTSDNPAGSTANDMYRAGQ